MLSRGLLPFSKLAGGAPQNIVTSRIFVRIADLLSTSRLGWLLRVKPLEKGFRDFCTQRLVLCLFMPSVAAIASKTGSIWVDLVVRVGTGGRTGGIPMWLCRVLRFFAIATLWSRVRLLRAMLCGIERCFLDARVQFMCCWPCSGCVRRFRLSRGVYIFFGIAPGSGQVQIYSPW